MRKAVTLAILLVLAICTCSAEQSSAESTTVGSQQRLRRQDPDSDGLQDPQDPQTLQSVRPLQGPTATPQTLANYYTQGFGSTRNDQVIGQQLSGAQKSAGGVPGDLEYQHRATGSQRPRKFPQQRRKSSGSVPGRAGRDFPSLNVIPRTGFRCRRGHPGYFADIETGCQVFHICQTTGRKSSFLCPAGSIFNQRYLVCDWWFDTTCEASPHNPLPQNIGLDDNSITANQGDLSLEASVYPRKPGGIHGNNVDDTTNKKPTVQQSNHNNNKHGSTYSFSFTQEHEPNNAAKFNNALTKFSAGVAQDQSFTTSSLAPPNKYDNSKGQGDSHHSYQSQNFFFPHQFSTTSLPFYNTQTSKPKQDKVEAQNNSTPYNHRPTYDSEPDFDVSSQQQSNENVFSERNEQNGHVAGNNPVNNQNDKTAAFLGNSNAQPLTSNAPTNYNNEPAFNYQNDPKVQNIANNQNQQYFSTETQTQPPTTPNPLHNEFQSNSPYQQSNNQFAVNSNQPNNNQAQTNSQSQQSNNQYPQTNAAYQQNNNQYPQTNSQYQQTNSQYQQTNNQYQSAVSQYQQSTNQYQPNTNQFQTNSNQYQPTNNQYQQNNNQYPQTSAQYQPNSQYQTNSQYQQINDKTEPNNNQYQQLINPYQPINPYQQNNTQTVTNTAPVNITGTQQTQQFQTYSTPSTISQPINENLQTSSTGHILDQRQYSTSSPPSEATPSTEQPFTTVPTFSSTQYSQSPSIFPNAESTVTFPSTPLPDVSNDIQNPSSYKTNYFTDQTVQSTESTTPQVDQSPTTSKPELSTVSYHHETFAVTPSSPSPFTLSTTHSPPSENDLNFVETTEHPSPSTTNDDLKTTFDSDTQTTFLEDVNQINHAFDNAAKPIDVEITNHQSPSPTPFTFNVGQGFAQEATPTSTPTNKQFSRFIIDIPDEVTSIKSTSFGQVANEVHSPEEHAAPSFPFTARVNDFLSAIGHHDTPVDVTSSPQNVTTVTVTQPPSTVTKDKFTPQDVSRPISNVRVPLASSETNSPPSIVTLPFGARLRAPKRRIYRRRIVV